MPDLPGKGFVDSYGGYTPDGIHRQKVRARATVYSHVIQKGAVPENDGRYELFRDLVSFEATKSIKGGGGCNFVLVPRRNYLNLIYPNDYVSIYVDPGDGRGWIRTFFGLIDRVSRVISADQSGATSTRFQVVCSDLTKAFDHVQIYFNPQLLNPNDSQSFRPDIASEFTQNLGGINMMMSGISIHGTPGDILMSLCQLFLGFGAQFTLPPSLASAARDTITANRKARVSWARERMPEVVRSALEAVGAESVSQLRGVLAAESRQLATERNGGLPPTQEQEQEALVDVLRGFQMKGLSFQSSKELFHSLYKEQSTLLAASVEQKAALPTASLLDLIDFRHMEWRSIDGSILSASITQQEGTLWSLMNAYSQDFINELFVDLRPMQPDPTSGAAGGGGYKQDLEVSEEAYSRVPDSLQGNVQDSTVEDRDPPGVRYEPCIVLREHPFSTVHDIATPPELPYAAGLLKLPTLTFGAIFSRTPGITGRKAVKIRPQNPYLAGKEDDLAIKSLDAITISVTDIINENVGRSDADHVNFIEVYSDLVGGGQIKSIELLTRAVIPVTSSIHVSRHGLRVRKLISKFGRMPKNIGEFAGDKSSGPFIPTIHACIRWAMLMDHWYQHNTEYLTGSMTLRGLPELRVGYRLDVKERNESFYVENVSHQWNYTNQALITTVQVTRGQPNNPFPVYVLPSSPGFSGNRQGDGRLGQFCHFMNPSAVTASQYISRQRRDLAFQPNAENGNFVDNPDPSINPWASNPDGFVAPGASASLLAEIKETNKLIEAQFRDQEQQADAISTFYSNSTHHL